MTDKEKKEWVERNIDCYENKEDAWHDLEKRIAKKNAQETRVVRGFKNRDEYNKYSETHKMGQSWLWNKDNFENDYSKEYEEFVAVCAYEYK